MKTTTKRFWQGFATLYLFTGLLFASGMYRSMPALNIKGAIYYGIIWPVWPASVLVNHSIAPIPSWAFTFNA